MRHFWIFVHLLGFVMWLGGALGAMAVGLAARREPREHLAAVARLLAAIYRGVILPGTLATVISGLALTLIMYGTLGAASRWLMAMQGTGLVAALIVLIALVPGSTRILRVDPIAQAAQFDALRAKQARLGMISGLIGLLALLTGALGRP